MGWEMERKSQEAWKKKIKRSGRGRRDLSPLQRQARARSARRRLRAAAAARASHAPPPLCRGGGAAAVAALSRLPLITTPARRRSEQSSPPLEVAGCRGCCVPQAEGGSPQLFERSQLKRSPCRGSREGRQRQTLGAAVGCLSRRLLRGLSRPPPPPALRGRKEGKGRAGGRDDPEAPDAAAARCSGESRW